MLADAVENLPYLEPAVAIILGFVGVKLALEFFGLPIDDAVSLLLIVSLLGGGVGLSVLFPPSGDEMGDENQDEIKTFDDKNGPSS